MSSKRHVYFIKITVTRLQRVKTITQYRHVYINNEAAKRRYG